MHEVSVLCVVQSFRRNIRWKKGRVRGRLTHSIAVKASRRYQIVHVGAKGWEKDSYLFFAAAKICCGMSAVELPRALFRKEVRGGKRDGRKDTDTYSEYSNEEDTAEDYLLFQWYFNFKDEG
jgi:hypothetical protein